jgi:hypothetical protein
MDCRAALRSLQTGLYYRGRPYCKQEVAVREHTLAAGVGNVRRQRPRSLVMLVEVPVSSTKISFFASSCGCSRFQFVRAVLSLCSTAAATIPSSRPANVQSAARRCCPGCRLRHRRSRREASWTAPSTALALRYRPKRPPNGVEDDRELVASARHNWTVDRRCHVVGDRQPEAARIKELRSVISKKPFRASAHMLSSLSRTRSRHNSWGAWGYPNACNSHSIAR